MCGLSHLFNMLVIILLGHSATAPHCDMMSNTKVNEGNIGQAETFNWLGMLKVHLRDFDAVKVAVTGIVLVKIKYAIANADDIVRIPQNIFAFESQAMFLADSGDPWYVPLVSYITHPEYQDSTSNSIAIIKLNLNAVENYPLKPICLPSVYYNTSNYLYLIGYTDENKILEKMLYKITYLATTDCEEFYNSIGLSGKNYLPNPYFCGYSLYNPKHCIWDNGMALVSNASGWFSLIGFGVRGPGCASPARFIDIHPYIPWIESVTSLEEEISDSSDYRRHDDTDEFVPAHNLFLRNVSGPNYQMPEDKIVHEYISYPFDVEKPKMFNIEPFDDEAVAIFPFNTTMEMYSQSCQAENILMYREKFEVRAPGDSIGTAIYKLTLYDLIRQVCTCVKLTVNAYSREDAILSFKEILYFNLATQIGESGETPKELFQYYPLGRELKTNEWSPSAHFEPNYIHGGTKAGLVWNYDLYIKFEFIDHALLNFEIFAPPEHPTTTTKPMIPPKLRQRPGGERRKNQEWGMEIDNTVKEPVVTLVAEPEAETVSKGRCIKGMFATVIYLVGQIVILI